MMRFSRGLEITKKLIFTVSFCLFPIACDQGGGEQPQRSGVGNSQRTTTQPNSQFNDSEQTQTSNTSAGEDSAVEEKIDASTLEIYNMRVVKKREQLFLSHNLSFEPAGKAEFATYQICPLEDVGKECPAGLECTAGGACVTGIAYHTRLRLPMLYAGKVQFKLKACIGSSRALTSEVCGPWEEKIFDSQLYNQRVAQLMGRALSIKKSLGVLNNEYKEALETFVVEGKACDDLNAEVQKVLDSKVGIIEFVFRKVPDALWTNVGEQVADEALGWVGTDTSQVIGGLETGLSAVGEFFEEQCVEFGKDTKDEVCEVFKIPAGWVQGILAAMSPVTALGTLSNAIHDVYYGTFLGQGDKLVPKACFAEQNLQRSVTAIERRMDELLLILRGDGVNSRGIKGELEELGESSVIVDPDAAVSE